MTRSRTAQVFKSNLVSLHGHSATALPFFRLGYPYQTSILDSIPSRHKLEHQYSFLSTSAVINTSRPAFPSERRSVGLDHLGTSESILLGRCLTLSQSPPSARSEDRNKYRTSFQQNPPLPIQSHLVSGYSLGYWTAAILLGVSSAAVCYSITSAETAQNNLKTQGDLKIQEEYETKAIVNYSNMTGEELPGRPGTLTPEQEEKLREFWVAVLQVFGVIESKEAAGNGHSEAASGAVRSDTSLSSKKPKKKRMGLFRKKDADEPESVASTESNGYGHIGTSDADDKYGQNKEFHDALAHQTPESLRATFWSMVKHDHPDALLLRFLRARKWDVEKALVMMVSTMRWRSTEMHVDDDIMKNGELGALNDTQGSDLAKKKLSEDFLAQMRLGKSFLHGLDKEGRPMCFVRVRLHKQGEQSEESLERYTVFIIESARMVLSPPIDTACVVFDMTGFSLANMDYAPVKFMIKCFEANYPESLGVVLVHKAPWVFQGIWKVIRGWLDPVVASKVQFTNNNAEMEQFVPGSQIISELQGAEDWTYNYIEPVPGENDKMEDIETRDKLLTEREGIVDAYEKATLDWIHEPGNASNAKKKRHEIANELRDDYWKLDPYIRARSYYDRVGMLNDGGKLSFYPGKTVGAVAAKTEAVQTSADDID